MIKLFTVVIIFIASKLVPLLLSFLLAWTNTLAYLAPELITAAISVAIQSSVIKLFTSVIKFFSPRLSHRQAFPA
jgi:hypothetical protein